MLDALEDVSFNKLPDELLCFMPIEEKVNDGRCAGLLEFDVPVLPKLVRDELELELELDSFSF